MTVVFALSLVLPGVAQPQPIDLVLTPLSPDGTPRPLGTPVARQAEATGGVGSLLGGQQAAAQATIAAFAARETAQATRIAALEADLAEARVTATALEADLTEAQATATALVLVAANTVLDPTRQSLTFQTDLDGMLNGDAEAIADARTSLTRLLDRYPSGCRAGFMLISGNAPTIEEGVALAQSVETVLREFWADIFTGTTGAEVFALPNQPPAGQVSVDIFFYAGCQPTG